MLGAYFACDPELTALRTGQAAAVSPGDGADGGSGADQRDPPALRLIRYFAQPFYVAEPFSGRPGTWIARPELLDSVQAILDGRPAPA